MTVPERSRGPGPSGRALFLFYWLPVLAYTVFIFLLSSIPGAKVPGPFPFMDKLAHMLEYSLFGLLVGRAIRFTWTGAGRVFMTLGAVGIGAMTGLLDELYQSRVPGRSSDPYDWLVDVLAVTTAVVITQVVSAKSLHNRTQE